MKRLKNLGQYGWSPISWEQGCAVAAQFCHMFQNNPLDLGEELITKFGKWTVDALNRSKDLPAIEQLVEIEGEHMRQYVTPEYYD